MKDYTGYYEEAQRVARSYKAEREAKKGLKKSDIELLPKKECSINSVFVGTNDPIDNRKDYCENNCWFKCLRGEDIINKKNKY